MVRSRKQRRPEHRPTDFSQPPSRLREIADLDAFIMDPCPRTTASAT
jgi:hypothetical protein